MYYLVHLQQWECSNLALSWSSHQVYAGGGGQSVGRYTGSWHSIQLSTCNLGSEWNIANLGWMLDYIYTVLSVNLQLWHEVIEIEDITLCTVIIVQFLTRLKDGGWSWGQNGGYEVIWAVRVTTCLIGLSSHTMGSITCQIGSCTSWMWNCIMLDIYNLHHCQLHIIVSIFSSSLLLCCAQPVMAWVSKWRYEEENVIYRIVGRNWFKAKAEALEDAEIVRHSFEIVAVLRQKMQVVVYAVGTSDDVALLSSERFC